MLILFPDELRDMFVDNPDGSCTLVRPDIVRECMRSMYVLGAAGNVGVLRKLTMWHLDRFFDDLVDAAEGGDVDVVARLRSFNHEAEFEKMLEEIRAFCINELTSDTSALQSNNG